jgi:hypothetical protein
MAEEVIYKAENGSKMLFRILLFGALILITVIFWNKAPIFLSFIIGFSFYQILFFKFSTLIVYKDRIHYLNKNILNVGTERGILKYSEIYELIFTPSEVNEAALFTHGILAGIIQGKKNEITVAFTDNKSRTMHWGGHVYEIQIACEKANEIIAREFNRPKF